MSLAQLRHLVTNSFDIEELRTICFDLNVDFDNLSGEGKAAKTRELIALMRRSNRLPEFINVLTAHRPTVKWGDILIQPAPLAFTPPRNLWLLGGGFILFGGVVFVTVFFLTLSLIRGQLPGTPDISKETPTQTNTSTPTITLTAGSPTQEPSETPTISPSPDPATLIEPVGEGEYMILIAQLEHRDGPERDVTRDIFDNLVQTLEVDFLDSKLRVREHPDVILTHAQAVEVAEANRAAVIVWGNYQAETIRVNIEVGSITPFPNAEMHFDRELIERTANVTAEIRDLQKESVAFEILVVLHVLFVAGDNSFEMARLSVIQDEINKNYFLRPALIGNSAAVKLHDFGFSYYSDPTIAITAIEEAITKDSTNPFLFFYRGVAKLRLGNIESAYRDLESASANGPEGWANPIFYRSFINTYVLYDLTDAFNQLSLVANLYPDDWFYLNNLGNLYYIQGNYQQSTITLEKSITLTPEANWPYLLNLITSLRLGDLQKAQSISQSIRTQFPNIELGTKLFRAALGDQFSSSGYLISSAGKILQLRFDDALIDIEVGLAIQDFYQSDLYFLQGLAYCNLSEYESALTAFDQAIAIEEARNTPFVALYLLHSEVLIRLGNPEGALQDIQKVQQILPADAFTELQNAINTGQLSCQTILQP